MRVVFVHGAGRTGASAWPQQAAQSEPGWAFLDRSPTGDDPDRDATRVLTLLAESGGGHVVAHSYGANAGLLAATREPELVQSLSLLEPACFDLARGRPAVEEHITALTTVYDAATDDTVSAREFSAMFAAAMGTEVPDVPNTALEDQVARLRALRPPWGTSLKPLVALPVPTLVVTGGWSDLYEQTADALVLCGAHRAGVSGSGHRVQDAATTNDLLHDFWRSVRP